MLRIAHLYPDQMNIYGDRGNILTLVQRCRWRGMAVEVLPVLPGAPFDWAGIDLAFFGGGQDSGQALIAADLVARQGAALRAAVADGLVLLAICGGYQLLGHYFLTHTGERLPGTSILDVHTIGGTTRMIGNVVVEAVLDDDRRPTTDDGARAIVHPFDFAQDRHPLSIVRLVGFENHSGRTYLGTGARPLGRVLAGHGNNGEDGTEGAVVHNVFGCYMHGSLLPKNPQFADHLIGLALARRGVATPLPPLDDTLELRAQRAMVARLVR